MAASPPLSRLAMLVWASLATSASAQTAPMVTLRVVDASTGRPVGGARATMPSRDLVTAADASGTVTLDLASRAPLSQPGCVLRVSATGYRDAVVACDRMTDDGALTVALVAERIRLAEQVVVTARLDPVTDATIPRGVAVVTAEDIERRQPRTTPEALDQMPGVWVQKTNHGGGSPVIRGLVGNQVLVLVDGIRLNNATFRYGPNQYLSTIDIFSLDRIEVVRGAASVLFGSDALGGVVNVLTRQPELAASGHQFSGRALARWVPAAWSSPREARPRTRAGVWVCEPA